MRALAVLACMVGVAHAEPADPPSVKTQPIKIGVFLSMTGASATFGIATLDGIKLAIDEHNAQTRGRKLELQVLDTAGKASETGEVVTRLVDEGAVALLGEVASSLSIAGARIAQQRRVPMLTPSSTNPRVTDAGDMISRACFVDAFQGYAMAKFARSNLKATKVAVLVDQSAAYSTGLADAFAGDFVKLGGKIVSKQTYTGGDADHKAQLQAIKAAGADALFIPGFYTDVAVIARQARAIGLKIPLLGGDGWDSEELAKIAGAAIDNSYYANHFAVDAPAAKPFVAAFRARYRHDPDGLAALGYDAARVLADAITRSKSLAGADLAAAIRSTKKHAGATGPITIDANGTAKSAVIVKLVSGKPVTAASIAPQ